MIAIRLEGLEECMVLDYIVNKRFLYILKFDETGVTNGQTILSETYGR